MRRGGPERPDPGPQPPSKQGSNGGGAETRFWDQVFQSEAPAFPVGQDDQHPGSGENRGELSLSQLLPAGGDGVPNRSPFPAQSWLTGVPAAQLRWIG